MFPSSLIAVLSDVLDSTSFPLTVASLLITIFDRVPLRDIGQWNAAMKKPNRVGSLVHSVVVNVGDGSRIDTINRLTRNMLISRSEVDWLVKDLKQEQRMYNFTYLFCVHCSGVLVRKYHTNGSDKCYQCSHCKRYTCSCRKPRN